MDFVAPSAAITATKPNVLAGLTGICFQTLLQRHTVAFMMYLKKSSNPSTCIVTTGTMTDKIVLQRVH